MRISDSRSVYLHKLPKFDPMVAPAPRASPPPSGSLKMKSDDENDAKEEEDDNNGAQGSGMKVTNQEKAGG